MASIWEVPVRMLQGVYIATAFFELTSGFVHCYSYPLVMLESFLTRIIRICGCTKGEFGWKRKKTLLISLLFQVTVATPEVTISKRQYLQKSWSLTAFLLSLTYHIPVLLHSLFLYGYCIR